jgi:hypothetical protein
VNAIAIDHYLVKLVLREKIYNDSYQFPLSVIGIHRAVGNGLGRGKPRGNEAK